LVRRLWLVGCALIILPLAGCRDSGGAGPEVQAFDRVQASPFVFEADPANLSRGIFHVTTTEPMICAIVWGVDDSFGNFNNSLDMAGTGIVTHDVFLPGAEPGVEYRFVVEGVTADGTIYRSDVGTFVIPGLPGSDSTVADARTDLALGARIAGVSSEFSPAFAASNAVDGDLGTEWSTAGDGNSASITIDLGAPSAVSGFEWVTRSMADGSAVTTTYTVVVDSGESLGPFPAGTPADPRPSEVDVTGQVFIFSVATSTGGNTGAAEIRILGS
jgi:F5/8 type C domain